MKVFLLLLLSLLFQSCSANDTLMPKAPNPPRLVNNLSLAFPDLLSNEEKDKLETKLVAFSKQTTNQIAIVIVDDLKGLEPGEFATRLGNSWGVGQKDKDNGIVILIKPTGGKGERKTFVAIGEGLEKIIPNAMAQQVVDDFLLPNFKNNNFYQGIDIATTFLMSKLPK